MVRDGHRHDDTYLSKPEDPSQCVLQSHETSEKKGLVLLSLQGEVLKPVVIPWDVNALHKVDATPLETTQWRHHLAK